MIALDALVKHIHDDRDAAIMRHRILGMPEPKTEKEWLLFNLNEGLRRMNVQRKRYWRTGAAFHKTP